VLVGGVCFSCDTDSVIFIQKDNDPQKIKTRDYLDELTDELEEYGSCCFVDEFVSGGPKKLRVFGILPLDRKMCNKMQNEGYNLEI